LGISVVTDTKQLKEAFHQALKYYHQVMVENFVEGVEITVGILDDLILTPIKIKYVHQFFDYESKYQTSTAQDAMETGYSEVENNEIKQIAFQAYRTLECKGWARVDLIKDRADNIWVLEINTVPGFRKDGLIAATVNSMGITTSAFLLKMLEATL